MNDDLPRRIHEALVRGRMDDFQALTEELDPRTDEQTRAVVYAGFMLNASAKWTETTEVAEIRYWVAGFRNRFERNLGEINAFWCESLIIGAITRDPQKTADLPANALTNLVSLLSLKLATDRDMTETELQSFLDQAEQLANG